MFAKGLKSLLTGANLPVVVGLLLVIVGGVFLLNRADAQARDTIRKHHLDDIEQALYSARGRFGTYPPYDRASWCGELIDPQNNPVVGQIEEALRFQNEKYANLDKPFPTDPLLDSLDRAGQKNKEFSYFYIKHSPVSFSLLGSLEMESEVLYNTVCESSDTTRYNYSLNSVIREL